MEFGGGGTPNGPCSVNQTRNVKFVSLGPPTPHPPPPHTQTHFLPQIAAFLSVFLHFFSLVFCMLMLTFCVCDLDLKQKLHTNANNLKSESDGCFSHENYQDIFVNKFQFQRAN